MLNAIEVEGVSKVYRRYAGRKRFATLKSALLTGSLIRDLKPEETFTALNDVSLQVRAGTTFGVVGRNGSGKSTLLKLIAGITKPTSGTVAVDGRLSALIELGAGFHPEISGRENVYINGIMLGLSKREIAGRFDEIVRFAELEDFIDQPVKTYSSGMYMRLGFAVAINVDPDVLLIDEVLAVGDEAFTRKCLDKIGEFRRRGKTILLVTHSLGLVDRLCDEAIWLDGGRVRAAGDPRRVIDSYITDVQGREERQLAQDEDRRVQQAAEPGVVPPAGIGETAEAVPADFTKAREGRWGSREVEIADVRLLGEDGQAKHLFRSGERMEIRLAVSARQRVEDFVFGIGIFNADGACCYGTNTVIEEYEPVAIEGDGEVIFAIDRLDLVGGTYTLDVAVHRRDGYPYDYHRTLYSFRVRSRLADVGVYRPAHTWKFPPNIKLNVSPRQASETKPARA